MATSSKCFNRLGTLIFLCLLSTAGQEVFAQPKQSNPLFERFTTENGLSNNSVNCVFQDSRGLIWIGTDFGLNLYDGVQFTSFYHIGTDSNSLPHNQVLSISEDDKKNIWIGTQGGFSRFNLLAKTFTNWSYRNKGQHQLDLEKCYAFVDRHKKIWVGHTKGILQLDPTTGLYKHYNIELAPPGQFQNTFVSGFTEDEQGLWVATSFGVYRKNENEHNFRQFRLIDKQRDTNHVVACTRMMKDKSGNVYAGTWNSGLYYWNRNGKQFIQLFGNIVVTNLTSADQQSFIATYNGVIQTRNVAIVNSDSIEGQMKVNENPFSFQTNDVLADKSGDIWLATTKGLIHITSNKGLIHPLSYKNINDWIPVHLTPSFNNQQLYILTGLDLILYDRINQSFSRHSFDVKGKYCYRLAKGKKNYWLCGRPGLYRFDKNLANPELAYAEPFNAGFSNVFEDESGLLWLGAGGRNGIRIYDPEKKTISAALNDSTQPIYLGGKIINDFAEDEFHNIWIASFPLIRYNRKEAAYQVINIESKAASKYEVNDVTAICPDLLGKVWIGTLSGLFVFNNKDNSVKEISLPSYISSRIDNIAKDKSNNIWFTTSTGLVYFDPVNERFRLFNKQSGFPENNTNSLLVMPDSTIVTGYDGGIAFVDPKAAATLDRIPTPQWTGIRIDNVPITEKQIGEQISLRHNQAIDFSFVSPAFRNAGQNKYTYTLEGIDDDWNYIGSNTSQRFVNLPAGKYTFKVKSGDNDNNWNEEFISFSFNVKPVFWKTWWFMTLLALGIIGLVYAFYRYRLKQAVAVERLRTRIATDLHDDIGATLSSISFYSEAVKQKIKNNLPEAEQILEKMGETSRRMVGNMSDIVWAINPGSDAADSLVKRIHEHASELCQLKNLQLVFDYDNTNEKKQLDIETRKNIYLIFKEAFNNALKYSGCTRLTIKITTTDERFSMAITDNGKGFLPNQLETGNGLNNMKARALELGGQVRVISSASKGTTVELNCPLP